MPKEKGGLGIKDIGTFNLALLGKWEWNLLQEKGEIWSRVLESKYGGWRSLYEAGRVGHQSMWWTFIFCTFFDELLSLCFHILENLNGYHIYFGNLLLLLDEP